MAGNDSLPPRFFKVFLSHFSSHSMVIPASYYDELPLHLPKTALIHGTGGCFWKVSMIKKRDAVFFGQGWAKVVEDNRLSDGDVLTFIYDGYNNFKVSIYGNGGCKEARAVAQFIAIDNNQEDSVCSLSSEEESNASSEPERAQRSEDSNISEISSEPEMVKKTGSSTRNKGLAHTDECREALPIVEISEDSSNSDSSYSPGESKAIKAFGSTSRSSVSMRRKKLSTIRNPETYLDDPKNLYFETVVKNRIYELLVDRQLVKDYGLRFNEYVNYIDKHEDGEVEARTSKWHDGRVCIKGWTRICERNGLKKGDKLLFELFRKGSLVYAIKIHIIPRI